MPHIEELSPKTIDKIKSYRYDSIIEKHEGPRCWESVLEYYNPDFMEIDKKIILLPLDREHHKNITILRKTIDKEEKLLIIFLKDTTYIEKSEDECSSGGFVAICEKVPDEEFYLVILYHEWFIIEEHIRKTALNTNRNKFTRK